MSYTRNVSVLVHGIEMSPEEFEATIENWEIECPSLAAHVRALQKVPANPVAIAMALRDLLDHLPDSVAHAEPAWDACWSELDGPAREAVRAARLVGKEALRKLAEDVAPAVDHVHRYGADPCHAGREVCRCGAERSAPPAASGELARRYARAHLESANSLVPGWSGEDLDVLEAAFQRAIDAAVADRDRWMSKNLRKLELILEGRRDQAQLTGNEPEEFCPSIEMAIVLRDELADLRASVAEKDAALAIFREGARMHNASVLAAQGVADELRVAGAAKDAEIAEIKAMVEESIGTLGCFETLPKKVGDLVALAFKRTEERDALTAARERDAEEMEKAVAILDAGEVGHAHNAAALLEARIKAAQ